MRNVIIQRSGCSIDSGTTRNRTWQCLRLLLLVVLRVWVVEFSLVLVQLPLLPECTMAHLRFPRARQRIFLLSLSSLGCIVFVLFALMALQLISTWVAQGTHIAREARGRCDDVGRDVSGKVVAVSCWAAATGPWVGVTSLGSTSLKSFSEGRLGLAATI